MLVVVSKGIDRKHRIYHRPECMYAKRIKDKNLIKLEKEEALNWEYRECKCCSGLAWYIMSNKRNLEKLARENKVEIIYKSKTKTLYVYTDIGFWKIFYKADIGRYLLYHRNSYTKGMDINEAINGFYHRQKDVKANKSLHKIIKYIVDHDRAKVIIMEDYRKLPKDTKKQKMYYNCAKKREEKRSARRLDELFLMIEKNEGIKELSFC